MSTSDARRYLLQSGPGALARLIGNPSMAKAIRHQATALERAVGEPTIQAVAPPRCDQPHFEVLDEGDELLVLAELPAARAWELRVYAYAGRLSVHLREAGRRYSHQLPTAIIPASVRPEFRNGILSVWLTKRRVQGT
jgi:HSP20 family molecular chaperone IbpA